MCGIVGIIDLLNAQRANPDTVRAMTDLIRHRGPDGGGFFFAPETYPNIALGMRRLSIIDLAGGDQPIANEDGSIQVVYNGEIYNYVELQAQLEAQGHVFRTACDTETLVHLYEQYDLDLFEHLRGMYAFALWDRRRRRLLLAVDHVGIKPLYYCQANGKLVFASEVKAMFADPDVPRALNIDVLDTYLSFGYPLGAETLFNHIKRLMPGHALVVERGKLRTHCYYKPAYPVRGGEAHGEAYDEAALVAQARALIRDSVRLHLRSDVPLGLFLSGGVDSATLLALMTEFEPGRVKTFTVGYAGATPDNEFLKARRAAQHFASDHHELIIDAEDWWAHFLGYVYHHDEPNANPSAISLMALAELTRESVKVVLNGTGGDELFCGYPDHHALPAVLRAGAMLRRILPRRALDGIDGVLGRLERAYPAMLRYRFVGALPTYLPRWRSAFVSPDEALRRARSYDGRVFSDDLRRRLYAPDLLNTWQYRQHKERTFARLVGDIDTDDPDDLVHALILATWIPTNGLLLVDKVTMAHSLEARVPFFDPPLLDFAAHLPVRLRGRGNKYVLRRAMAGLLPDEWLTARKQPFGTPILMWFDGPLRDRIRDVLLDPRTLGRGYFDAGRLEALLNNHFAGRVDRVEVIFRLLTLELWQRCFLD
ncbi:MAG: asparagine synthase (glutamine-hydrolyzing) [Anaerolineae bacterium]|nr:asparagine synthase (glutamine-hydrolyzing) [Anaerolineae bacterium]